VVSVGFGDYPTITQLNYDEHYRKMAVMAWHDPGGEIKYRFVWVDDGYGISTPPVVVDPVLGVANISEKSSGFGRPAVAMLWKTTIGIPAGFVIVWEDAVGRIKARVFQVAGPPSAEIIVDDDASPGRDSAAPSVIATPDGFCVVWMADAPLWTIKGRAYQVTIT